MNKNKKIYIVLMLAMGFFMTSCSNFLEIQPTGKVIPNTLEEYRALMTEVYANSLTDRSVCDMRTEDIIVEDASQSQTDFGKIEKWIDDNSVEGVYAFLIGQFIRAAIYQRRSSCNKSHTAEADT